MSESSGQPQKMSIGSLDNQKKVEGTKNLIASLKELVEPADLKLVLTLL